ncbi:hypothetical protein JL722_5558 [Aureococcus anophagefferens]|nr:hypothetical protein JL722_5558 [Aureococcus anophagefferens]
MGERKVLNRYFPPDFDPLLVPRRKWDPYKQVEREDPRVAHPKKTSGKKFNSRKEDVVGDTYLGIRKYRFYIKCCVCSNEIAFKTDPQNQDYVCESGATRNFESWRQQDDKEKEFEDEQKESNEQRGAARHS